MVGTSVAPTAGSFLVVVFSLPSTIILLVLKWLQVERCQLALSIRLWRPSGYVSGGGKINRIDSNYSLVQLAANNILHEQNEHFFFQKEKPQDTTNNIF